MAEKLRLLDTDGERWYMTPDTDKVEIKSTAVPSVRPDLNSAELPKVEVKSENQLHRNIIRRHDYADKHLRGDY